MAASSRTDQSKQPYRPSDLIGGPRRTVLLAVAALSAPLLVYLLSQHGLFAAVGFVVVAPLLVLARPGLTVMLLAPIIPAVLLVHAFPSAAPPTVGGVFAALVLGIFAHVGAGMVRLRADHVVIALLAAVLGISLLFPSVHLHASASPTSDLIGVLEGLILFAAALAAPPSIHRLAQLVAVAGAVEGVYALARGEYVDARLVTETLNPNYLGAALVVPTVMAIGLTWTGRRPVWLLAALPSLAALVATRSRGAMVAVVAGLLVLIVVHLRRTRWPVLVAVVAGLAGLALLASGSLAWMQVGLGGRSANELTYNNGVRADAAWFAVQVALDNPLRGIGYGIFAPYAGLHSSQHIVINTHNDFLRLAAEAGLPALLLFVYLLWRGLRTLRNYEHVVLGAAIVAYAVGLLFANVLSNLIVTAPFWVALGAMMGRSGQSTRTGQRPVDTSEGNRMLSSEAEMQAG